jgi:nitrogen regulatory protein PII
VPKVKIEIAVNDDIADKALTAIVGAAKTGQVGDGKIFVTELAEVIRVRTGESGPAAL